MNEEAKPLSEEPTTEQGDSTTTNLKQIGSTSEFASLKSAILLQKQGNENEETAKLRERIKATYGPLQAVTLIQVEAAEMERELCEGCAGVCQKEQRKYFKPEVRVDGGKVFIGHIACNYGQQRELTRAFRSARIPTRYFGKTFNDYNVDAANKVAVDYAKRALKHNCGAYFYGECGTGKTFLAALIAQEFLKDGQTVIFVKVPALLDDIKATFNGNGRELDILDKLKTADLVILDDFGMEAPTQWAGATLCKVLDTRYDSVGKTIITSNLSLDELARHLNQAKDGNNLNGSRIADRCREICKPILLKGTSRRN